MATPAMKSFLAKTGEVDRKWYCVDAQDKVLGRLAVNVATVLMGKHRPIYTPHTDTGDFVVVLNAGGIKLTGRKRQSKTYQRFSGYPGGQKEIPVAVMLDQHPDRVIRDAVRRMMPKNRLARQMLKKLKIYPGIEHPHQAQCPEPLEMNC